MSKWTKGLRAKLLMMGVFPILVLGLLSYIALNALGDFNKRLDTAYNVRAKLIESAGEIDSSVHALGRWMWLTYGLAGQNESRNKFIKNSLDEIEELSSTIDKYLKLPRSEKIIELFATVEKEWPQAKKGALDAINYLKTHNVKDNELAKKVLLEEMVPHLVPMSNTMNLIKQQMHILLEKEIDDANNFASITVQKVVLISGISMLACFIISILIAIGLAKKLTTVSSSLHEASVQVHSASTQIAASSEELSQAATEQAASLEETAASLEEISSMIAKSTDSAKMTSASSTESQAKAEEGKVAVEQMITSMDEISESNEAIMVQINQSNQQMSEIVKVIQEIGEKTKVINDIVFQTKLLSFNASVEAARAGEHGKGFAVVAEEVGNLAQMSGNAAREISDMLTGSISKVERIVQDTKTKVETLISSGKQKVDSGVSVARQCAEVLGEIVENVTKVSSFAHEISSASQEQAQGVAEINKAMSQMDTVTQQNAATSEEAASAAEELSAQSEALKSAVEDLVRTVDGGDVNNGMSHTNQTMVSQSSQKKSVKKPTQQNARVIHLRSNKVAQANHTDMAKAVGDNSVPDRNHNGFKDI